MRGINDLLTDERLEKLKDIGFIFNAKQSQVYKDADLAKKTLSYETAWNGYYDELKKFKEEHGHCLVPKLYPQHKAFSSW